MNFKRNELLSSSNFDNNMYDYDCVTSGSLTKYSRHTPRGRLVTTSVIKMDKVSISFEENHVLSEISVDIKKGEIYVVIGPSGQGKSSFLKLIAGIYEPTSGGIKVGGVDWQTASQKEKSLVMQGMGMLFQKNALFDSLSSAENIGFPLHEKTSLSKDEISNKINYFLEEVGLAGIQELFPDEISGGMQKRLGIARALALDPSIVLYDDPTAGLDPITSRLIVDLILKIQKQSKATVVAVTNDMNRAFQMADRVGMIVSGELIEIGSREEANDHPDQRVRQFVRGELEGPLTVVAQ